MADFKTSASAPRIAVEDDAPPEDAPPPYSPPAPGRIYPHQLSSARATQQPATRPPSNVERQFPPEFALYSASMLGTRYHLGEHQDTPIYAVTTHSGWSGNPDVVLHSALLATSPPLATANFKTFSSDTTIQLPPLNASSAATQTTLQGSMFQRHFFFSVEIPLSNGQMHSEPFEWRTTRGDDVQTLGGWGSGWKLMRAPGPAEEIVAVFTGGMLSLTKKFCFKFVGAGDSGALGERWAVMAVVSAMAIWEKERRSRNRSAA